MISYGLGYQMTSLKLADETSESVVAVAKKVVDAISHVVHVCKFS